MFESILRTIVTSIFEAAPLALATLGIVLIFKTSFTTNFAQGSIGTVGSFVASYLILATPTIDGTIPTVTALTLFLAIVVGVVFGFILGLLVDILIFRNSRYINSGGKQIITMGLVLVISGVIPMVFGSQNRTLPRLGSNVGGILQKFFQTIIDFFIQFGVTIRIHQLIGFFLSVILLAIIFIALRYTKWGLGVRATASNEIVAGMMGINTRIITAMSWAIAGGLGTVAAILIASSRGSAGSVVPYLMINTQVQAFFSSILGGFSTFGGPMIGVLIFSLLKNFFSIYLSPWGMTSVYIFILVVVLIKPLGLFGKKIAKKV
ncbi:MAG: branched-chain amino acid ABC transporter permease [Acholeplasmataceae bacterium]|nr:branched-chain amino acid ABC transporter permease [Acholeplasmataceae bacterium]